MGLSFVLGLVLAACSGGVVLEPTEGPVLEARKVAQAATPANPTTGIEIGTPAEIALRASGVFFESAQIVVLASSVEPAAHARAASIALTLGAPFLLTAAPGENLAGQSLAETAGNVAQSGGLNNELLRLGTRGVITVGEVSLHQIDTTSLVVQPAPDNLIDLGKILQTDLTELPAPAPADEMRELAALEIGQIYTAGKLGPGPAKYGSLPETLPAERNHAVITFSAASTRHYAGVGTARAAGAQVFVGNDPGTSVNAIEYMAAHPGDPIVGFGEDLQDPQRLQRLADTLHAGVLLPTGAQRVFRFEDSDVLVLTVESDRILGEEGIEHAGDVLSYAQEQATRIERSTSAPVVPGVEVAVTRETEDDLAYWVDQVRKHDQYLVLTVRPRGTLLEAVEELAPLLSDPRVGIRVDLSEREEVAPGAINEVNSYLRRLVREQHLPQKILIFDLGATTRVGTDIAIVPTTPEVALTFSVDAGQPQQWEEAHASVTSKVSWAISVLPKQPEEPTEEPIELNYPEFAEIQGRSELSLLAYR